MDSYSLIDFQEFFTAPWVQVWGSILAAALGSGLAVWGAVWFQNRDRCNEALALSKTLRFILGRVELNAADFATMYMAKRVLGDLRSALVELERDADILDRLSPFSAVGKPEAIAEVLDVTVLLGRMREARRGRIDQDHLPIDERLGRELFELSQHLVDPIANARDYLPR